LAAILNIETTIGYLRTRSATTNTTFRNYLHRSSRLRYLTRLAVVVPIYTSLMINLYQISPEKKHHTYWKVKGTTRPYI